MTEIIADPEQEIRRQQCDLSCTVQLRNGIEVKTRFGNALLGTESFTL